MKGKIMRNIPVALTDGEAVTTTHARSILTAAMMAGDLVTLTYTKRDGSASASTGVPTGFNGTPGTDTASVIMMCPDKGRRTINMCRISGIAYDED